jgi:hypothetical protein
MDLTFLLISVSVVAGCHIVLSLVAGYLAWYYRKQWKQLQALHRRNGEDRGAPSGSRGRSRNLRTSSRYGRPHEEDHHHDPDTHDDGTLGADAQQMSRHSGLQEYNLTTFEHPRTPPKPLLSLKSPERGAKTAQLPRVPVKENGKTGESSKLPQVSEIAEGPGPAEHVESPPLARLWYENRTKDIPMGEFQYGYI